MQDGSASGKTFSLLPTPGGPVTSYESVDWDRKSPYRGNSAYGKRIAYKVGVKYNA